MCSPWTFARCDSLCLESALFPEQRILHPRSLILKGLNRTQVIWGKKSTKNWANKTPAILRLKSLGVAPHQKSCWGVLWYEWIHPQAPSLQWAPAFSTQRNGCGIKAERGRGRIFLSTGQKKVLAARRGHISKGQPGQKSVCSLSWGLMIVQATCYWKCNAKLHI